MTPEATPTALLVHRWTGRVILDEESALFNGDVHTICQKEAAESGWECSRGQWTIELRRVHTEPPGEPLSIGRCECGAADLERCRPMLVQL